MLVIFAFQAFAQIEFLTRGGPARSTETLVFKIFQRQTPDQLGEGAVMSVGLFVVTFVVTLGQFLLLDRRVHYGTTDPPGRHGMSPGRRHRLVRWPSPSCRSIVLVPIYFLFVRAISDPSAAFTSSVRTPVGVRWDAFGKAWDRGNLGAALVRSMVVTVAITVLQVISSVLAAYAFAFLRFPFKRVIFALFMATLLLPIEVTLLPNLQTVRDLGWFDTYQGMVPPFAAAAFGTFLVRQGFLGIPSEIRDAARLEGWGHLQFLFRFAVPLTRPVIASFTVIAFLGRLQPVPLAPGGHQRRRELGHGAAGPALPHLQRRGVQHPRRRGRHRRGPHRHPAHRLPAPDRPRPHRRSRQGLTHRSPHVTSPVPSIRPLRPPRPSPPCWSSPWR